MLYSLDQRPGCCLDNARHKTAGINHCVPMSASQGCQILTTISPQLLKTRKQLRVMLSPVEESNFMPVRQRSLNDMTPQKHCAAKYQKLHACSFHQAITTL